MRLEVSQRERQEEQPTVVSKHRDVQGSEARRKAFHNVVVDKAGAKHVQKRERFQRLGSTEQQPMRVRLAGGSDEEALEARKVVELRSLWIRDLIFFEELRESIASR